MKVKDLTSSNRLLQPHKAIMTPNFKGKTVIATSTWDFVNMWLKRNGNKESQFYWEQSKNFYEVGKGLPVVAAPLPLYYCFLNAVKALLEVKGTLYSKKHGVSSNIKSGNTNLKNETVIFQEKGVLAGLQNYLKEHNGKEEFSMWELLYNLPFVHRCFNLTYPTESSKLFIPIKKPRIVSSDFQHYGWFTFEVEKPYANKHTINKIEDHGYKECKHFKDCYNVRTTKRFKWYYQGTKKKTNYIRLQNYFRTLRTNLYYISADKIRWYIKRCCTNGIIVKSQLSIMFSLMHRLSEMARYEPYILSKHFELKQNWLLTEFIEGAATQFIDQIACEITNENINTTLRK